MSVRPGVPGVESLTGVGLGGQWGRRSPPPTSTSPRGACKLLCQLSARILLISDPPAEGQPISHQVLDSFRTDSHPWLLTSTKAHPAKAGAAKLRVLASSATPHGSPADAPEDPTTAELPRV
jgi:hypothetical protein